MPFMINYGKKIIITEISWNKKLSSRARLLFRTSGKWRVFQCVFIFLNDYLLFVYHLSPVSKNFILFLNIFELVLMLLLTYFLYFPTISCVNFSFHPEHFRVWNNYVYCINKYYNFNKRSVPCENLTLLTNSYHTIYLWTHTIYV